MHRAAGGGLGAGEPDLVFGDDHEAIYEPVAMLLDQPAERFDLAAGPLIRKAQEDDAPMGTVLAEDLVSEILVVRDQDPIFGKRLPEDRLVVNPPGFVIDRKDLVPLLLQPAGQGRTRALVHEEAHRRPLYGERHERGVLEGFRGE